MKHTKSIEPIDREPGASVPPTEKAFLTCSRCGVRVEVLAWDYDSPVAGHFQIMEWAEHRAPCGRVCYGGCFSKGQEIHDEDCECMTFLNQKAQAVHDAFRLQMEARFGWHRATDCPAVRSMKPDEMFRYDDGHCAQCQRVMEPWDGLGIFARALFRAAAEAT